MNYLRLEISQAINRACAENGSNTPDFILAEYLGDCLLAFDKATQAREKWHGRAPKRVPFYEEPTSRSQTDESDGLHTKPFDQPLRDMVPNSVSEALRNAPLISPGVRESLREARISAAGAGQPSTSERR